MPWQCAVMSDYPVIETRYAGELDPSTLELAVRATLQLAERSRIQRFLADCTELLGGHSILTLFDIANTLSQNPGVTTMREAVLLPKAASAADDVRFWETVCLNRGVHVRIFNDRTDALRWLNA